MRRRSSIDVTPGISLSEESGGAGAGAGRGEAERIFLGPEQEPALAWKGRAAGRSRGGFRCWSGRFSAGAGRRSRAFRSSAQTGHDCVDRYGLSLFHKNFGQSTGGR